MRDHCGVDRHWWPRVRPTRATWSVYCDVDLRSRYTPGVITDPSTITLASPNTNFAAI